MRKPLVTLALVALLTQSGCTVWQGTVEPKAKAAETSVVNWFNKPDTQEKIQVAAEVAAQFLATAGLGYAQSSLTGVKVDPTALLITSAVTTLYAQASNIRKLQGTTQVLDPVATATALQQAGTPAAAATQIGQQIVTNIQTAVNQGLSPDVAAEQQAAKLDTAAAIATNLSSTGLAK